MNFDDISSELKAKAMACKTHDELVALAEQEGIALTDEQLDAMAGGSIWGCSDQSQEERNCTSLCDWYC